MFAFGGLVHVLIVDPAPAVARDFMAQLREGGGQFGVALQRHADAEDGQRQLPLLEFAQDAPHAHARTVFVDAFHADVPFRKAGRVEQFRQELFGSRVSVEHAVFTAFFVIQHKLDRDARIAGPLRMRRIASVADQVAGVGQRGVVGCHREWAAPGRARSRVAWRTER
ncbi:hypothetical protein D3C85_967520 [compost metagenome]